MRSMSYEEHVVNFTAGLIKVALRTIVTLLTAVLIGLLATNIAGAASSSRQDLLVPPGTPVTAFVVPGRSPTTLKFLAVATERQVIPFANIPPNWNTLPPRSLPVQHVVLLVGTQPLPPKTPHVAITPSFLEANCVACWTKVQLDVNPEYVRKMSWEGVKLIAVALPIPKTGEVLKFADIMTFVEIAKSYFTDGPNSAGAKLLGWFAGKSTGFGLKGAIDPDHPVQLTVPYVAKIPAIVTERSLAPKAPSNSEWSWQTTKSSGGIISSENWATIWRSRITDTYKGTSLHEGWTSNQTTTVNEYERHGSYPLNTDQLPTTNVPSIKLDMPGIQPYAAKPDMPLIQSAPLPAITMPSVRPDMPPIQPYTFKPDMPPIQPHTFKPDMPPIQPHTFKPDMPPIQPYTFKPDMPPMRSIPRPTINQPRVQPYNRPSK